MLNFIAFRLIDFMLRSPLIQKPGRNDPISKSVLDSATLPNLLEWIQPFYRTNAGILLAVAMVLVVSWVMFRTTWGFESRATGASPDASKYAGIKVGRTIIAAMAAGGALAGLAGGIQVLGVLGRASPGFSSGIGFEAIAVALLGRAHPVGVLLAGLLFGALEAGGRQMQVKAGVSVDLITIIQALIVVFIAAPILIRRLYPFLLRNGR
jgi:simple sugar transport system permease protein